MNLTICKLVILSAENIHKIADYLLGYYKSFVLAFSALIKGFKDIILIVWCGEFGRTIYSQGKLSETSYSRDHHPDVLLFLWQAQVLKKDFLWCNR